MGIIIFNNGKLGSRGSMGQYNGEKIPGDLKNWNVLSSDANKKFYNTYGLMSERSATLYHTYGPVKAAVDKQTQYAIGNGLLFRSQPSWRMIPGFSRDDAKEWGREAQQIIHYYFNMFDFYDKQIPLFSGALTTGDALLFFIREGGKLSDLVEFSGDQINWSHTRAISKNIGYTLGIKHDQLLRPLGIMKYDTKDIDFNDSAGNANLLQFMIKEQPRQLRGNPLAYAIINLAKNDDRHHDATVARAIIESILIGSFETDVTDPARQTRGFAARNKAKVQGDDNTSGFVEKVANFFNLGAGNMYKFRKGESMKFNDLKTPSNNFGEFKQWMLNYIGAATGTPAQVITSRYETSYTSHKGAFNDFIKSYTYKRKMFERNVMNVVVKECLKDAILNGLISAPGFFDNPMIQYAYCQGSYLGPVPGAINPVQEANANEKNVKNAFVTRSDIASLHGNEFDNMINEWGDQEKEWFDKNPEKQAEIIQGVD
jgi:hypothetical protein